jgi:sugar lactone lactonase YvrE
MNKNLKKIAFIFFYCFMVHTNAQIVTTLAGSTQGFADDNGTAAQFNYPSNVALDASGAIYVADPYNHRIRKISADGVVTTFAGSTLGFADGTGTAAQFNYPFGVAVDVAGNVYVADRNNNCIRKITAAGIVTTLAGGGQGSSDGIGSAASFYHPYGLAVDTAGNVFVADTFNNRIRKITATGLVTTLAGSTQGFSDGLGTFANFYYPQNVAVDAAGNVFVADTYNNRIRKITSTGMTTTMAGSSLGFADGTGTGAKFYFPDSVAIDATGNVFAADSKNHRIRKITPLGVVTTVSGSTAGSADGVAAEAHFNFPEGVAIDAAGTIFVADNGNHRVRKITATLAKATYQLENQISLYPNPAEASINISIPSTLQEYPEVVIFNASGKEVMKQKKYSYSNKFSLDVTPLSTGVYIYKIGEYTGKFIKE